MPVQGLESWNPTPSSTLQKIVFRGIEGASAAVKKPKNLMDVKVILEGIVVLAVRSARNVDIGQALKCSIFQDFTSNNVRRESSLSR